jgi:hypothetical protein
MSDPLVIEFPTEAKADEIQQNLLAMQNEYLIELGDAVVEMSRGSCPAEPGVRSGEGGRGVKVSAGLGGTAARSCGLPSMRRRSMCSGPR